MGFDRTSRHSSCVFMIKQFLKAIRKQYFERAFDEFKIHDPNRVKVEKSGAVGM